MRSLVVFRLSRGFSLIEVLVASLILFLVLATVTITYSGAVKGTMSATESLKLNNYVPILSEHISLEIKDGKRSGNARFIDLEYHWSTELIESKPVIAFFDSDNFEVRESDITAYYWRVTLTTQYNGRQMHHVFKALSWT